jgi:aminoglycoside phosphotransferase (APT) family kinase protein
LHDVDAASVGLDKLGKPEGFMLRQIDGWAARYDRAKTREIGLVADLTNWLHSHLPPSLSPTLLHNDWRLDNIMLDSKDPARVEAVFDWDMCTVGDPLADLGTLLSSWAEAGETTMGIGTMPSTVPGFLKRREAVERYAKRRGVDVQYINFYYVFGLFKIAVVLQQIFFRYDRGQTKDERFQAFDQLAELLFQLAKDRIDHPAL